MVANPQILKKKKKKKKKIQNPIYTSANSSSKTKTEIRNRET